MRPRGLPADDAYAGTRATVSPADASMRPRGLPADDLDRRRGRQQDPGPASMRPRGLPADDGQLPAGLHRRVGASMRPRGLPADDISSRSLSRGHNGIRFNEAAGTTRG